jgi:hypothetical protein
MHRALEDLLLLVIMAPCFQCHVDGAAKCALFRGRISGLLLNFQVALKTKFSCYGIFAK